MDIYAFPVILTKLLVLLISFPVHELAHAWTANRFGDDTPRVYRRLTFNPLAHLDVMGSLVFMLSYFGWAKPVPVNPYVLKRHSRYAYLWVSLAGPLSNLILAILVALPIRFGIVTLTTDFWFQVVMNFIFFNLILAIFNMIPLAPLDGGKIFGQLLPTHLQNSYARIEQYGPMILIVLLFVLPMIGFNPIGALIGPILNGLFAVLTGS